MIQTLYNYLAAWVTPILILLTGILLGWIFKRYVHSWLHRIVKKTAWQGDEMLLHAIEPYVMLWFFLLAFYIAGSGLEIADPYGYYLTTLIKILLILSVTIAVSKVLVVLLKLWSEKQSSGFPSTAIFTNLVRIVVIVIGFMIVLESLEITIAPVLTALGVGGLAVSLALKDTLSDFFSGLHILLSEKVKPGDFVELSSGERGYIANITWRNTTMIERTNNIISIPNSRLSTAIMKNYDKDDTSFSVRVQIGVAYDSDLELVQRVTEEVAQYVMKEVEGGLPDFIPPVRFFEFADSSINLRIYFRVRKYGDQHPILHEFIKRIHKRYKDEGIEIPFPIRTVVHKNRNIEGV